MTLREYTQQYNRPEDNNFAVHCYAQKTRQELYEALARGPDKTDCELWNLSRREWRDAVRAALDAQDARIWAERAEQPLILQGEIFGQRVNLEDNGARIIAGYLDEKTIEEDMITFYPAETITQGDETVVLPETTDIDSAVWHEYFEALIAWVATETGEDVNILREHWHPDCCIPTLYWDRQE